MSAQDSRDTDTALDRSAYTATSDVNPVGFGQVVSPPDTTTSPIVSRVPFMQSNQCSVYVPAGRLRIPSYDVAPAA
jgi:hypothetical protein